MIEKIRWFTPAEAHSNNMIPGVDIAQGKNYTLVRDLMLNHDFVWDTLTTQKFDFASFDKVEDVLNCFPDEEVEKVMNAYLNEKAEINPKHILLNYSNGIVTFQPLFPWNMTEEESSLTKEELLALLNRVAELFEV